MRVLGHLQDYPPRSLPPTIMSQRFERSSTSPNQSLPRMRLPAVGFARLPPPILFLDLQKNKSKFPILGHPPPSLRFTPTGSDCLPIVFALLCLPNLFLYTCLACGFDFRFEPSERSERSE